ncbi:MAG: globin domain-containing protein [Pseudomonadota bacterium]
MTETLEDTPDHVRIRRNWAQAASAGEIVGRIFYTRLFEIAPSSRAMFGEDIEDQARKLLQTLNWIIDHLDQPETLKPAAESLAIRHVGYGVVADDYPAVGEALIDTLAKGLGDDFTAEDAAAWGRVYTTLSGIMTSAAYPEPAAN